MRIFVAFEDVRLPLDVQQGQTIGDVKIVLRDYFKLNSSHMEEKILQLTYAGAVLNDKWVCSDIGITSGATVKSFLKDSDKPVLHIYCPFNNDVIAIREQIDHSKTFVSDLRVMVSKKTGLPVSVFRLCAPNGKEMYDCHTLDKYQVFLGTTIHLHVWNGWSDLLSAAVQGHTKRVYMYASSDEQIARYQYRVACFIAAHFGYVDLANSLINPKRGGVKPEEPVGQHPSKQWSNARSHGDVWKCPVHEAAQFGKVNVLRIFVQNNICCLVAKDANGRTPIQTACKYRQADCILYLSSKLYSSYTENTVTLPMMIVIRCRKWCEKARERVLSKQGAFSSSLRRRVYKGASFVGHGVIVDGFGESMMRSKSKAAEILHIPHLETENSFRDATRTILKSGQNDSKWNSKMTKISTQTSRVQLRTHLYSESSSKALHLQKSLPLLARSSDFSRIRNSARDAEDQNSKNGRAESVASYIVTPKLPKSADIIQQFQQSKVTEGTISLPAVSVENTLRPFFHVSSRIPNPVQNTLKIFEKYREMTARNNAIQCMTVASTFKDKAWLRQVDMAISLAKRGVINSLTKSKSCPPGGRIAVRVLPTVPANPIKHVR